jgi:hypothetical protein
MRCRNMTRWTSTAPAKRAAGAECGGSSDQREPWALVSAAPFFFAPESRGANESPLSERLPSHGSIRTALGRGLLGLRESFCRSSSDRDLTSLAQYPDLPFRW